jgi:ABC-type transport system substrate-binding protein
VSTGALKYSNPAVDALITKARVTTDEAQRTSLYDQILRFGQVSKGK